MAVIAESVLQDLLKYFPQRKDIALCFAYGSGVFPQKNRKPGKINVEIREDETEGEMIDLIFAVDDPLHWHKENLRMNPGHYSDVKKFGPERITSIQEKFASGVYFNPYCDLDGRTVKYGVISTKKLEEDLRDWKHLYVAGRLQKPVLSLIPPSLSLADGIKSNHKCALAAALLLQTGNPIITKWKLFHTITKLSYIGDTRMRFAESPNKTKSIVGPLFNEFDSIYTPILKRSGFAKEVSDTHIVIDNSCDGFYDMLLTLPMPLQRKMVSLLKDPKKCDIEEVLHFMAYTRSADKYLHKTIKRIVRLSSLRQTLQGIVTAGVFRSIKYGLEKVGKRFPKLF